MKIRTLFFVVLLTVIWAGNRFYYTAVQPDVTTELAVKAVNGDSNDAAAVRINHSVNNDVTLLSCGLTLLAFAVCYGGPIKNSITKEFA